MANEKIIKKINYNGTEYEVGIQSVATTSENGLMSARDKTDFDAGVLIAGNTVNLGGSLSADTLRSSLGLSNAMHFRGKATVAISDNSTTDPQITGYTFSNAQAGDVVIDKDGAYEYVWNGSKWEKLGPDSYGLSISGHTVSIVPGGTTTSVTVPDNNTWQANTVSQEGYVSAPGSSNTNKVWKTDGSGNPGWRDDANNTYSTGAGLTTSGSVFKAALVSETLSSLESGSATSTTNRQYPVMLDKNGKLSVNVPWDDTNTWNANTATQAGYVASPNSAANKVWKTNASGVPSWQDDANTTYTTATNTNLGLVKPWYSHTAASTGPTTGSNNTAVTVNAITTTSGKYYAVESDSNGRLFVNVPWANDNTWQANSASQNGYVTAGSGNGNKVWKTDASGNPAWREDANNTYSLATYNNLGLVKPAYTSTGAASLTTTAASNTTTPTIAAKSTTSGRYYAVEADKNGILFVNVPWANDNTWTKVSTSNDGYISKLSGNTSQFLRGDGTWATPPDTKYTTATSDTNGLVKLFSDTVQSVAANAVTTTANRTYGVQLNSSGQMVVNVPWSNTNTWNAMTGATVDGNGTVGYINAVPPSDGYNTKYWRADGTWAVPKDTTYAAATNSTLGLVKLTSTTKQTVAAQALTTTDNRTYAVQFNNDNQLVVNVPWTDNNTDTKVTQAAAITTAGAYPVLLAYSTATTAVTNTVNKSSTLTYNPNTKTLVAENITGTASKATADASGNTITSTYATKTELNNLIAAQDVMVFKGVLGTGTNMVSIPAVPYNKGWVYRVGTAGTYAGKTCEVGDVVICVVDRASGATGSNDDWIAIQANVDKPAYFANTTPGANKVIIAVNSAGQVQASDYTIGASVPSDAKFTDTTYGAEKGISLASGKFGHSNTAITAQTTQAVYPIKIDAYGHITGYGAAQTILALGTTATTAAAGNHNHDATYVNVSGDTMTGALLVGTKAMTVSAGKITEIGNGQTGLFKDGIAISNPSTKNDAGWIRVTGTGESDTVLEIATGDDAGAGEKIVARQYNTSNAVAKEAEILGINGVTTFPVSVTAPTFYGNLDWSYIQSKPTILTIGTTATTAAAGNHTHTTTLDTDTGTAAVTLAHGTTYKLTTGGTSVIFKTPADSNTDTKVNVVARGTTKAYLLADTTAPTSTAAAHTAVAETAVYLDTTAGKLVATSFAGNGSALTNLNGSNIASGTVPIARIPTGTTSSTVALGNHTHTTSLASDTGTSSITLSHGSKYKLTAGGTSVIFTMPSDNNTDTKVAQTETATDNWRKVLIGYQSTAASGAAVTSQTEQAYVSSKLEFQSNSGTLRSTKYLVDDNVTLEYNSTTQSLDFIFA